MKLKFTYLFLFLFSFQTEKVQAQDTLVGDLYFGLWRAGSFYDQPAKVKKSMLNYFETVSRDSLQGSDKELVDRYDVLKKHDLLESPYVQILLEKDSVVYLYLPKKDYKKIKIHKLETLEKEKKKIVIVAVVNLLGADAIKCERLISVAKVDGQTYMREKKFAIEDYD